VPATVLSVGYDERLEPFYTIKVCILGRIATFCPNEPFVCAVLAFPALLFFILNQNEVDLPTPPLLPQNMHTRPLEIHDGREKGTVASRLRPAPAGFVAAAAAGPKLPPPRAPVPAGAAAAAAGARAFGARRNLPRGRVYCGPAAAAAAAAAALLLPPAGKLAPSRRRQRPAAHAGALPEPAAVGHPRAFEALRWAARRSHLALVQG
jgi:hypothetical protein